MADLLPTGIPGIWFERSDWAQLTLDERHDGITVDQWRLGVTRTLRCLVTPPCGSSTAILRMIKEGTENRVRLRDGAEEHKVVIRPRRLDDENLRNAGETMEYGVASVSFTPQDWDNPAHKPSSLYLADEHLFHELVHVARELSGLMDYSGSNIVPKVPRHDQDYQNLEEFCAVVITNIYRSENLRPDLRRDHGGEPIETLPDDLCDPANFVDLWYGPLCRLKGDFERCGVFHRIAVVQCKFNPFGELQRRQLANAPRINWHDYRRELREDRRELSRQMR